MAPKPFHCSLTILSNFIVMAGLVLMAASDPLSNYLVRRGVLSAEDAADLKQGLQNISVVLGLGGSGGVVAGRLRVGDLYTPRGLPGPNADDLYEAYANEVSRGLTAVPNERPVEQLSLKDRFDGF